MGTLSRVQPLEQLHGCIGRGESVSPGTAYAVEVVAVVLAVPEREQND